jgi:hypothetical protein
VILRRRQERPAGARPARPPWRARRPQRQDARTTELRQRRSLISGAGVAALFIPVAGMQANPRKSRLRICRSVRSSGSPRAGEGRNFERRRDLMLRVDVPPILARGFTGHAHACARIRHLQPPLPASPGFPGTGRRSERGRADAINPPTLFQPGYLAGSSVFPR